ncbi:MAG: hypothetical protein C0481_00970 [Phenylobacterium sp.]|uniref:hypothetical protein n=1 Tax=Phenylobacterium sp. TaxID=1871053 RepID=UPI0025D33709|nr:hypothetical protein [Phenylobacterium sp.]MBA4010412.1 hypothetical protein [Phenylobacterium sp.]
MIRSALIAVATLVAFAGAASAQAPLSQNPPTQTIICLDVGGQTLPVSCKVPASRLDKREDFCTCRTGTQVDIGICPDGVKPPAENRAYEKARKAAVKNGSLLGATYEGRPMCVTGRNTY